MIIRNEGALRILSQKNHIIDINYLRIEPGPDLTENSLLSLSVGVCVLP